jgi:hypothetical protein
MTLRRSPALTRERMVEIPVIDDVLVVPGDLAGIGVNGQRAVVVEVLLVVAAERELRRGDGHRRADVDQVQLGVVARHHPGADVPALLHRHVAPRLVARLAGSGDRVEAPELPASLRVVRRDHAGVAARVGLALAARDQLAVGDNRSAARGRALVRVEHLRLPDERARPRVERVDEVVRARVEDQIAPHRERAIGFGTDAFGELAAVFPNQVAGRRVDRLDVVARVRDEHHAVVHERRAFLVARADEPPRPDHLQARHVRAVDLIERTVPPAVQRAAPGQPVSRIGLLQHRVGHRHVLALALSAADRDSACDHQGANEDTARQPLHGSSSVECRRL